MSLTLSTGAAVRCVAFSSGKSEFVAFGGDLSGAPATSTSHQSSPEKKGKKSFFKSPKLGRKKRKDGAVRVFKCYEERTKERHHNDGNRDFENHLGGCVHFVRDLVLHKEAVCAVCFDPRSDDILCSASEDGRYILDLILTRRALLCPALA